MGAASVQVGKRSKLQPQIEKAGGERRIAAMAAAAARLPKTSAMADSLVKIVCLVPSLENTPQPTLIIFTSILLPLLLLLLIQTPQLTG